MADSPSSFALGNGRVRSMSERISGSRQFSSTRLEQRSSVEVVVRSSLSVLGDHESGSEIDFLTSLEQLHLHDKRKLLLLHRGASRPSHSQQVLAISPAMELQISRTGLDDPAGDDQEESSNWIPYITRSASGEPVGVFGYARPRKLSCGLWMWSDSVEVKSVGIWTFMDIHVDSRKLMIYREKELYGIVSISDVKGKTPKSWKIWSSEFNRRLDLRIKDRECFAPRIVVVELRTESPQKRDELLRLISEFRKLSCM